MSNRRTAGPTVRRIRRSRLVALTLGLALITEFVTASVLIAALREVRVSTPTAVQSVSVSAPVAGGRTVRLLSLGGIRTDGLLTRVGADLGAAIGAVERFWGTDWGHGDDPEITVVATDSEAQFLDDAHLDTRRQWADIAAVSVADEVDLARRTTSGQRIVFAPGAAAMNDSALRIVLTHELFHRSERPALADRGCGGFRRATAVGDSRRCRYGIALRCRTRRGRSRAFDGLRPGLVGRAVRRRYLRRRWSSPVVCGGLWTRSC